MYIKKIENVIVNKLILLIINNLVLVNVYCGKIHKIEKKIILNKII